MALILIILFVVGAVLGSFLNVVIYRLPRGDDWRSQLRSLAWPGSHCPECDSALKWYDNIPLVSYAVLGGRCRKCGLRIAWHYPFVEFTNAALYALAGWHFGLEPELVLALLFISVLIVIFFIDLEHYIIPNVIVLPAAIIGVAAGIAIVPGHWLEILVAGVASGAFFFAIAFIKPGAMGMGDVKLAAMMGFFLGKAVLVALFLGFLLGAIVGIALIVAGRKGRKSRVPFGPFLAVGGIIALFVGNTLLEQYLSIFNQSM